MQIFWDFLKIGVPTTSAILGGLWVSQKGWKLIPTAGVVAAGWGAGYVAQALVSKVLEPSMESLPTASLGPGAIMRDVPVPSADEAMAAIGRRAESVPGVEHYQPDRRGPDGQPIQSSVKIEPGVAPRQDVPPPTPMGTAGPGGGFDFGGRSLGGVGTV